jgi:hypothetical protein
MTQSVPVNGLHVSSVGGIIQFTPWMGASGNSTNGGLFSGNVALDVARWSGNFISFEDDTTDTGTFGYQSIDVPCTGYRFNADLIYDLTKPADVAQRSGFLAANATAINSNFSVQCSLFIGNGQNYSESDTTSEWIFLPSVKVSSFTFEVDAGGKNMVRGKMSGVSNSGSFHMPYDANKLANYVSHLNNRSRVF